jgi:glucan 1,3-beta-glucosidase
MNMRRRGGGGPAMEGEWKQEDSWEGSFESGERRPFWKFWANWSKKKRIVIGSLAAVLILLAIVIPVAISEAKGKSSDSGSSSSDSSSGPANSNLDGISKDSIPVSSYPLQDEEFILTTSPVLCTGHLLGSIHMVRHRGFQCHLYQ